MGKSMTKTASILFSLLCLVAASVFLSGIALANDDEGNSQDHPLLSRMPNFYINEYRHNFDLAEFSYDENGETQEKQLEGQVTYIEYRIKDDFNAPSQYQIVKNYVGAVEKLGGKALTRSRDAAIMQVTKDGKEVWIKLDTSDSGETYWLTVCEVGEMAQEVATGSLIDTLNKQGRVAVYINFESGQAEIKEESQPVIDQIVAMMNDNPDLKLKVEGHTDAVGDDESNMQLSKDRADAVVQAMEEAGIDAARITAEGFGESKPIGDNDTEDGRAKNRRVELVKM